MGYGHTFIAPRESLIGVLPVGYADGYRRGLQHGGEVIVRGGRAVRVPVTLGAASVGEIEVVSGLAAGDQVVISDMRDANQAPEVAISR